MTKGKKTTQQKRAEIVAFCREYGKNYLLTVKQGIAVPAALILQGVVIGGDVIQKAARALFVIILQHPHGHTLCLRRLAQQNQSAKLVTPSPFSQSHIIDKPTNLGKACVQFPSGFSVAEIHCPGAGLSPQRVRK
ncbi:MAG: hypothetical protein ACI3VX_05520 [Faecousia sp.]